MRLRWYVLATVSLSLELFEHSSPRLPEMVDFRKSAGGTGMPEVG